jgi:8-amino-7-oxononanoate synthase
VSKALKEYLVNRTSGFIYSTALPPGILGAIDAAIDLIPTLGAERARLAGLAAKVRDAFLAADLDTAGSTTQIVPVILGDEERTLKVAAALEAEGLLGIAIRPPTVPTGTARIRFALSSVHSDEDIERLIDATIRAARTYP